MASGVRPPPSMSSSSTAGPSDLCYLNMGVISMKQAALPDIRKAKGGQVSSLSFHCNQISQIDSGLLTGIASSLRRLDLSSNLLCRIEGLDSLVGLEELNLSNNKLTFIEGLKNLFNLQSLTLSFNKIIGLEGIMDLHGQQYALRVLDIKGNDIPDINQLNYLAGCSKLQHIIVNSDPQHRHQITRINPFCKDSSYDRTRIFDLLPQVRSVDWMDERGAPVADQFLNSEMDVFNDLIELDSERSAFRQYRNNVDIGIVSLPSAAATVASSSSSLKSRIASIEKTLAKYSGSPIILNDDTAGHSKQAVADAAHLEYLESIIDRLLEKNDRSAAPFPYPTQPQPPTSSSSSSRKEVGGVIHSDSDRLEKIERQLNALTESVQRSVSISPKRTIAGVRLQSPDFKSEDEPSSPPPKPRFQTSTSSRPPSSASTSRRPLKERSDISNLRHASGARKENTDSIVPTRHLLQALETEERRLRQVELELNSKIDQLERDGATKTQKLNDYMTAIEEISVMLKSESGKLKTAVDDLTLKNALVNEQSSEIDSLKTQLKDLQSTHKTTGDKLMEASFKTDEMKSTIESMKQQHQTKDHEMERLRKCACDAEIALANAEGKVALLEDEKNRISVRFVKDREQYRVKMTEMRCESDALKNSSKRLQEETLSLAENVAKKDQELQSISQKLSRSHAAELKSSLATLETQLKDQHRRELGSVQDMYERTKAAYLELEMEYKNGIQAERGERSEIYSMYQELSRRQQESEKLVIDKTRREAELNILTKDLSQVVKEQKDKIDDLTSKNQIAFGIFEEKIQGLQEEKQTLLAQMQDYKLLQAKMSAIEKDVDIKDSKISKLEYEKESIQIEMGKQTRVFEEVRSRLDQNITSLSAEKSKLEQDSELSQQTMKVKGKVIDDLNETIKSLKRNLENKVREYQSAISDARDREDRLQERINSEGKGNDDLHREMESQQTVIEHLRTLATEYKSERDHLRKEVAELCKKIKERNASIIKIEEEVGKVKKIFKNKEDKLVETHLAEIRDKDKLVRDYQVMFEAQSTKFSGWDREREALLQTIKKLENEISQLSSEKNIHDEEMRTVLKELDKQRETMNRKMERLRSVFE